MYLTVGVTLPLPVAVQAMSCFLSVVVPVMVVELFWSNTAGPSRVTVYWSPDTYWPFPFMMLGVTRPLRLPVVYRYCMSRSLGVLATASFHRLSIFAAYVSQPIPSFQPRRWMPFRYSPPIGSSFWWMRPAIAACVRSSLSSLYLLISQASFCASGLVLSSVHSPHVPDVPV